MMMMMTEASQQTLKSSVPCPRTRPPRPTLLDTFLQTTHDSQNNATDARPKKRTCPASQSSSADMEEGANMAAAAALGLVYRRRRTEDAAHDAIEDEFTLLHDAVSTVRQTVHPLANGDPYAPLAAHCTVFRYLRDSFPMIEVETIAYGASLMHRHIVVHMPEFAKWMPCFVSEQGQFRAIEADIDADRFDLAHKWMVVRYIVCVGIAQKTLGTQNVYLPVCCACEHLLDLVVDTRVVYNFEIEILEDLEYDVMPVWTKSNGTRSKIFRNS